MRVKSWIAALGAASVAVASMAVPASAAPPGAGRGALLSVTPVVTMSRAAVVDTVAQVPLDPAPVRYGVTGYRVTYRTVDAHGRPTTASGLVALPDGGRRDLRVIAYDHGTRAARDGVASMEAGNGDREAVLYFASAGYAAVAPDYLGLGTGPGDHPYMDTATETTATLDMLDAARTFAREHDRRLDPGVLMTGFSQGGQAAMAVGTALQAGADPGWYLRALAPISGPYYLRRVELPAVLVTDQVDPVSGAFYLAYWTVSMNRLYHLYGAPAEVFQEPYASTVEGLFDGYHDDGQIAAALPAPDALITPAYRARLLHPDGALLAAMRANDGTCAWHPRVPVRLFGADGDRDVVFANARQCQRDLAAHGAAATLVDVGAFDHNTGAIRAVPQVLTWFAAR
jgi:hypothetical protein